MRHDLFTYEKNAQFTDRMAPFVADGLERGEAVVTVLGPENRDLMYDALGATTADRVTSISCEDHYTRPEAALADYDASVRELLRAGAPAVRLCGELPNCYSQVEWDAWMAYEAILNRAFAHHPVWIMCVYDERRLPASVMHGACRTHPEVLAESFEENPRYEQPESVVREMIAIDPDPLPELEPIPLDGGADGLRDRLTREMRVAGVTNGEARGMLAATAEVVANADRHGDGVRSVRAGRVRDRFACEISDGGPGLDDPLAGYLPPGSPTASGAGLWDVRQLTRRLELFPTPGGGLTARLWV